MRRILLVIFAALLLITGCQTFNNKPKYVFLFIGDGMGLQQVNATQVYLDSVLKNNQKLSFIDFPVQTFATTYAATRYITCSAAAGTALSTGSKTSIGTLGLNYNHSDSLFSIAKKLKQKGFKVGILTSVSIDHATPAAFYAHQGSRGSSYNISRDLINSGYDFFASGGFADPYGKKLKDSVESIYSIGEKSAFAFTNQISSIDSLAKKYKSIVYSIPNPAFESSLENVIDSDSTDVTLAQLTKKAIETLYNPKGFFMMVEGGKIDWACHSNDAAAMIHEVIAFSDAISQAVEFYKAHPNETLIIVTADHETGGFSLGNKENKYDINLSVLKNQKVSKDLFQVLVKEKFSRNPKPTFKQMLELTKTLIGLGNDSLKLSLNDTDLKQLQQAYNESIKTDKSNKTTKSYLTGLNEKFSSTCIDILNQKAAIGWTSTAHTGSPVPVYVIGVGKELYSGRLDNTDIPNIVSKLTLSK